MGLQSFILGTFKKQINLTLFITTYKDYKL